MTNHDVNSQPIPYVGYHSTSPSVGGTPQPALIQGGLSLNQSLWESESSKVWKFSGGRSPGIPTIFRSNRSKNSDSLSDLKPRTHHSMWDTF